MGQRTGRDITLTRSEAFLNHAKHTLQATCNIYRRAGYMLQAKSHRDTIKIFLSTPPLSPISSLNNLTFLPGFSQTQAWSDSRGNICLTYNWSWHGRNGRMNSFIHPHLSIRTSHHSFNSPKSFPVASNWTATPSEFTLRLLVTDLATGSSFLVSPPQVQQSALVTHRVFSLLR